QPVSMSHNPMIETADSWHRSCPREVFKLDHNHSHNKRGKAKERPMNVISGYPKRLRRWTGIRRLSKRMLRQVANRRLSSQYLGLLILVAIISFVPKNAAAFPRLIGCSPSCSTGINFGSTIVGTTSTGAVTLTNQGNRRVSISAVTVSAT